MTQLHEQAHQKSHASKKIQWGAIIAALVPVILAMATLLGRNTTLINENSVRIDSVENGIDSMVELYLTGKNDRRNISERLSFLEGKLKHMPPAVPSFSSDSRGRR